MSRICPTTAEKRARWQVIHRRLMEPIIEKLQVSNSHHFLERMILLDILEEHLEEADFLFQQRENALADRVYNMDDLAEIEERLLGYLDGLVLGEKEAWKWLEPKLTDGERWERLLPQRLWRLRLETVP